MHAALHVAGFSHSAQHCLKLVVHTKNTCMGDAGCWRASKMPQCTQCRATKKPTYAPTTHAQQSHSSQLT